jgi:hypothetical protein
MARHAFLVIAGGEVLNEKRSAKISTRIAGLPVRKLERQFVK